MVPRKVSNEKIKIQYAVGLLSPEGKLYVPSYSILFMFCSVPFRSVPFRSVPFRSVPFRSILFYSFLFYSILFYSILFYSILFYSILFYSILLYSILFYPILYYSIHICKYFVTLNCANKQGNMPDKVNAKQQIFFVRICLIQTQNETSAPNFVFVHRYNCQCYRRFAEKDTTYQL